LGSTTVAAGGRTTFAIRFDPLSVGSKTASIRIASNDSDEGFYDFTVTGTGALLPEIQVKQGTTFIPSGGSYDFGPFTEYGDGGTATPFVTFTIENIGNDTLTIETFGYYGPDFDVTAPLSYTIPGGGSTTFTVRFDPLAAGGSAGFCRISTDDLDEPVYEIEFYGN
jgi:trimeric autotransporter adhesin